MSALTGLRGRVTLTVLAVTAVLYSALGTLGFVLVAESGESAIRERIGEVLDDLEFGIRAGSGVVTLSTPDGVDAWAVTDAATAPPVPGTIRVERRIDIGGVPLVLVGRSAEASLTDSLGSLHRGLWLAVPLAALLSAAVAGFATHRALRPVGAITALAGSVGAEPDGARVPVPATADEIEQLAITVNDMLARIDEGRAGQRRFTSDAAHELRTPLMALQGELELLASGVQPWDAAVLDRLSALGHRLGERIDDLVLLSTLDERRPTALTSVDLCELVRREVAELAPSTTVDGHDVVVAADAALIARAVRNLLANARRHARDRIAVTLESSADAVWIHVDDDGPGIAEADRARVFERFSRLDEARAASGGGAGLGLAIVASVAGAHGGGATASSSDLGGARLSMWLPATSPSTSH